MLRVSLFAELFALYPGRKFELLDSDGVGTMMFTSLSNLRSAALNVGLVCTHASGKNCCWAGLALSDRVL